MSVDSLNEILEYDKTTLLRHLALTGVEHCPNGDVCACDVEDLQGLLYSFACQVPEYQALIELADYFSESFELVQTLVECNGGVTAQVLEQLQEQSASKDANTISTIICSMSGNATADIPSIVDCNDALVLLDATEDAGSDGTAISTKCISLHTLGNDGKLSTNTRKRVIPPPLPFGVHHLKLVTEGNGDESVWQQRLVVTSPVSRYVTALEAVYDRMYWGWEGQWTEDLERALLELVVSVEEDLVGVVDSLTRMMNLMQGEGSAGAEEMQHMLDGLFTDVQRALVDHSTYAVGRLHQTLLQFAEMQETMGGFVRVPPSCMSAIQTFITAKLAASMDPAMQEALKSLVTAATDFAKEVERRRDRTQQRYLTHLRRFLTCAERATVIDSASTGPIIATAGPGSGGDADANAGDATTTVPSGSEARAEASVPMAFTAEVCQCILSLKPSQLETAAISSVLQWHNGKVDHLPYLPAECLHSQALLAQCAQRLAETLLFDAVQLHSMLGYTMRPDQVITSAFHICALLDAGFAYVASAEGGKLLGLLPIHRSMLILNRSTTGHLSDAVPPTTDTAPTASGNSKGGTEDTSSWTFAMPQQLRKRAKDMQRIFRNNVKQPLSLRLNTNLDLAVQRLREHHVQDCWVGPALLEVWRHMCTTVPMQMLIFELWCGKTMIAADFAHPVNGNSVYVATRFFDRSEAYKRLAPGFLLALVETKFLRDLGCLVWDLGTANMCPLMRYKLDLTGEPLPRAEAMHELALAAHHGRGQPGGPGTSEGAASPEKGTAEGCLARLTVGVLVDNISVLDILN